MGYQVDLDPKHTIIRLTLTAEIVTLELADHAISISRWLRRAAARMRGSMTYP
jgi:hypothetical protein